MLKTVKLTTILLLAGFLVGCQMQPRQAWVHHSATQQQFYADRAECNAMAGSGGSSSQMSVPQGQSFASGFAQGWNQTNAQMSAKRQSQIFQDCMMGRGYFSE